jgi:dihydrofolate synthase / folylpolyglutamate synthase
VSYSEATAFLEALGIDAMKSMAPSLHRMEALCEVLDHPEQKLHAIHITGTNGKTSTARMAASILSATGLSVGTYTSPHLQTIRERVALNGEPITEEEFGDAFDHLHPFLDVVERGLGENLTFFEVLTGMFFLWAAETVDVAVVEVGLGGRWDATNMMDGAVAVITNVGLDHTKMLGDDPVTIAKEKAGIIKPGASVVTGERKPDVLAVIQEQADAAGVSTARLGREFEVTLNRLAVGGRYLSMRSAGRAHEDLYVPLHGSHQAVNAAVAVEAVSAFLPAGSLDEEVINEGRRRSSRVSSRRSRSTRSPSSSGSSATRTTEACSRSCREFLAPSSPPNRRPLGRFRLRIWKPTRALWVWSARQSRMSRTR